MHASIPHAHAIGARLRALVTSAWQRGPHEDTTGWTYEQRALRLMQRDGALDVATLIDRVADEAMQAAKIGGAAVLDIAIWGPSVFHVEAAAAIREMIGRTLVLECDGPWLLVVPATRAIPSIPSRRAPGIAQAPA